MDLATRGALVRLLTSRFTIAAAAAGFFFVRVDVNTGGGDGSSGFTEAREASAWTPPFASAPADFAARGGGTRTTLESVKARTRRTGGILQARYHVFLSRGDAMLCGTGYTSVSRLLLLLLRYVEKRNGCGDGGQEEDEAASITTAYLYVSRHIVGE